MVEDNYIERRVNINGKVVLAKYYPTSGKFEFGKDSIIGTDTTSTGAGAFSTMKELTNAFRDVDMPKVSYSASAQKLDEAVTKDRLYARALRKLGYEERGTEYPTSWIDKVLDPILKKAGFKVRETPPGFRLNSLTAQWSGPNRVWVRKKGLEHSLTYSAIIIICACVGLFFLSSNLTGKVISSLNQTSTNWVGGLLFILGLIGAFTYFKRK